MHLVAHPCPRIQNGIAPGLLRIHPTENLSWLGRPSECQEGKCRSDKIETRGTNNRVTAVTLAPDGVRNQFPRRAIMISIRMLILTGVRGQVTEFCRGHFATICKLDSAPSFLAEFGHRKSPFVLQVSASIFLLVVLFSIIVYLFIVFKC